MHVQFFPVYVLTCGAHNSEPLLSSDLIIGTPTSHGSLLNNCISIIDSEPPASHSSRISKAFLRS